MGLHRLISLGALSLLAAGCGAFADAAGDGGGQPPFDSTLSFFVGDVERETLRQGQVEEFRIVFDTPPPWNEDEGYAYRTRFDFEKDGQVLEDDVSHVETYEGMGVLMAILGADLEDPTGERKVYIDLAFSPEEIGQPQRFHRGQGLFYILPPHDAPDGGDGDGGDP